MWCFKSPQKYAAQWCFLPSSPSFPQFFMQKSLLQFILMGCFQSRENCCRTGINLNDLCVMLKAWWTPCSEGLHLGRASLIAVDWFLAFPFLMASKPWGQYHYILDLNFHTIYNTKNNLHTIFSCLFSSCLPPCVFWRVETVRDSTM